jgi:hypothetical protein
VIYCCEARNVLDGLRRKRYGFSAPAPLYVECLNVKVSWYQSLRNWSKKSIMSKRLLENIVVVVQASKNALVLLAYLIFMSYI